MAGERTSSLRILLDRLFDYAGMFPPASRSFEEALQESGSFRATLKRPWMIASDLVLDTEHARKLIGVNLGVYPFPSPLRICLLGTEDPESVMETVRQIAHKEPAVAVSSVEIKGAPAAIAETIDQYASLVSSGETTLALEPNLSGDDWEGALQQAVASLRKSPLRPALKCRLTGATGITAERFAAAIITSCDAGVPLKVTGGLHHPIVEQERYGFPMGFLNVTSGVMFRRAFGGKITQSLLVEILTNSDHKAYGLGDALRFKELKLSLSELQHVKSIAPFTIGSCSLAEPDHDLTRLFGDTPA